MAINNSNSTSEIQEHLKDRKEQITLIRQILREELQRCIQVSIRTVTKLPSNGVIGVTAEYDIEVKIPFKSQYTFQLGNQIIICYLGTINNVITMFKI